MDETKSVQYQKFAKETLQKCLKKKGHAGLDILARCIKKKYEKAYKGVWQCAMLMQSCRKQTAWTFSEIDKTFVRLAVEDLVCEVWQITN